MRRATTLVLLLLSGTVAAETPLRKIDIDRAVRATIVSDDGSGVVIADHESAGSTVVFFDETGEVRLRSELTIRSAVRRVGPRALFGLVATADETSRYVLFEQRGLTMEPVWDSERLPLADDHHLQHAVASHDGRMWAAVSVTPKQSLQVLIGELPSYDVLMRVTITPTDGGLFSDTPTLTWVRSGRKRPLVALNLGRSARLVGGDGAKQVGTILDVAPVATVKAAPAAGLVWVHGGSGLFAFDVASAAAGSPGTKARKRFSLPRPAGGIEDFFPLEDGTVAIVTSDRGKNRRLELRGVSHPVAHRSPWISPGARYIAEVEDGAVVVKRLR